MQQTRFTNKININIYERTSTEREITIIDFILIRKNERQRVKDVKVKTGLHVYSDHYMVKAKIQVSTRINNKGKIKTNNTRQRVIKKYKLKENVTKNVYRKNTEQKFNI